MEGTTAMRYASGLRGGVPAALAAALACALIVTPGAAWSQPQQGAQSKPIAHKTLPDKPVHRIVFQISSSDPALMNLVMNNAENLSKYYEARGEKVEMEFVAYGPGLAMVRNDVSPVKDRLAALTSNTKNLTVSGCGVTMSSQSKAENKEITLVSEARLVPTGVGRIVELQEQGWTYVRP